MATITITLSLSVTAASVVVTNVVRGDNGQLPSGISLPLSLVNTVSNIWSNTFIDTSPPAYYLTTFYVTLPNGSQSSPTTYQMSGSSSPVTGFWTDQNSIEQFLGQSNADQLSNLNNSQTGASVAGFQDAINRAQAYTNYQLALFRYSTSTTVPPFPTSSFAFPILCERTTEIAAVWLYNKRGNFDSSDQMAGKFWSLKKAAEKEIQQIIRNKIYDVPRSIGQAPAIVLNPSIFGVFSNGNPLSSLAASQIPIYPASPSSNDDIGPSP